MGRAWIFSEVRDNALTDEGTNIVFYVFARNTGKTLAIINWRRNEARN